MVGGGNRKDDGSFTMSNTNVFAALETLRKKKKSDKENVSLKGNKNSPKAGKLKGADEEKPVYWAPAPLTVKSWADVDDEDDDDYYATTAPPRAIWGGSGLSKSEETQKPDLVEESESEEDDGLLDEGDDDSEEEVDPETEVQEQPEPVMMKPVDASPAPKEADRQLSKKEMRKKELAELEAILADFGVNPKEKSENGSSDVNKDSRAGQTNVDADKKASAPEESKNAKKKKKKAKEPQDRPDAPNEREENAGTEQRADEDPSGFDLSKRLKKMASSKKKKSNKEMDAAARAAALEAAARSSKLAAAKKKEKNHYNQQPVR